MASEGAAKKSVSAPPEVSQKKIDGLERRRRLADEVDERISALREGMDKALRRAAWTAAALGAGVAVAVNILFHFVWR